MKQAAKPKELPGMYTRGETWWFTYRLNGKKHFHSLGTSDYGKAVQKALAIRQAPELVPAAVFEREIAAFLAEKVDRNEYSPFSVNSRFYTLRRFAKVTGRANPALVTAEDVRAFYKADRARTCDRTAHTYISSVRSFYGWLQKAGKIRENPVAALALARVDEVGRKRFCTHALRDKLIAEAPTEELRMILFLGFHAGLRKNEIIQARPEWFDLGAGSVNVCKTASFVPKDREERTIPLTRAFQVFLATYGLPFPFVLRPETKSSKSLYRFSFKDRYGE